MAEIFKFRVFPKVASGETIYVDRGQIVGIQYLWCELHFVALELERLSARI